MKKTLNPEEAMSALLDEVFGFDDPEEQVVDEDDLRWGLAVPEGWKNRLTWR